MRYPPQKGAKHPEPAGNRGWGPTGATAYWGLNNMQYTRERADVWPLNSEGELLAIVMVETRLGVKNVNEILSTPGLSGVLVGPSDLSMDLGVGPDPTASEVEAATEVVAKACVARKMLCGTFQSPPADVQRRVGQGFRLFTGGAGNYTAPR
jgi:4-hydroxy-2-oxoheptanedioate aldolase